MVTGWVMGRVNVILKCCSHTVENEAKIISKFFALTLVFSHWMSTRGFPPRANSEMTVP